MFSIVIVNVSSSGAGANVDAGSTTENALEQRYTEVTLSYVGMDIGPLKKTQTKPLDSPEKQAQNLAAFRARGLALPGR